MKLQIYVLALLIMSCNNQRKQPDSATKSEKALEVVGRIKSNIDSSLFINADSIVIASENLDTLIYSKQDYNEIVTYFPELYSDIPLKPEISYYRSGIFKDIIDTDGNEKHLTFGSEQGQDQYYILYAHFLKLKKKTDAKNFSGRRDTLIKIYNEINKIFGTIQYGGTYFAHQYRRIVGFAEHAIYWSAPRNDSHVDEFDVTKMKKLYLASFRLLISDEVSVDVNQQTQTEKNVRKKELFQMVDKLEKLITDNFYLKMAQEFQYSHY